MVEQDFCEVTCIHEDVVEHVQLEMKQKPIVSVSNLFKALADETRLKVAYALTIERELCVCDVATIIGASSATTSHHLRHLRKNGLAKYRKQGKLVYYSLEDDHVKELVHLAFAYFKEVDELE